MRSRADSGPGTGALLATGCGSAIASVCAIALYRIERLLGGLWSAAAVLVAAAACLALARSFRRLSEVVPSGAGMLAFMARAFGRRVAVAIALPYLLLCLLLVGVEATIVDTLVGRLLHLPARVGALAFLAGTWVVCRAGIRVGYRAQSLATWALVAALGGLSLVAMAAAAGRGVLVQRLLPPAPSAAQFVAGVGQSLFLFMGFELLTSQVEVARSPKAIGRALVGSVLVLALFYAVVALGFSCVAIQPGGTLERFAPQLAMVDQYASPTASALLVPLVVLVCLMASFTTFNGALLALSRLLFALAAQGLLPRSLARVEPRALVPRPALLLLFVLSSLATLLVMLGDVLEPAILAAAVTAAMVYAAATWARERDPFREADRSRVLTVAGGALALALVALAAAVIADAGPARAVTLLVLAAAIVPSLVLALRRPPWRRAAATPSRPPATTVTVLAAPLGPVSPGGADHGS